MNFISDLMDELFGMFSGKSRTTKTRKYNNINTDDHFIDETVHLNELQYSYKPVYNRKKLIKRRRK